MFMAYGSTWLDPTMGGQEGRINLTIVNVAIMTTLINMVYGEVPRTTYLNMLDLWLLPILYYCNLMVLWFIPIQHYIESGHPVYATYLEILLLLLLINPIMLYKYKQENIDYSSSHWGSMGIVLLLLIGRFLWAVFPFLYLIVYLVVGFVISALD